jgi:hypothetical protein
MQLHGWPRAVRPYYVYVYHMHRDQAVIWLRYSSQQFMQSTEDQIRGFVQLYSCTSTTTAVVVARPVHRVPHAHAHCMATAVSRATRRSYTDGLPRYEPAVLCVYHDEWHCLHELIFTDFVNFVHSFTQLLRAHCTKKADEHRFQLVYNLLRLFVVASSQCRSSQHRQHDPRDSPEVADLDAQNCMRRLQYRLWGSSCVPSRSHRQKIDTFEGSITHAREIRWEREMVKVSGLAGATD